MIRKACINNSVNSKHSLRLDSRPAHCNLDGNRFNLKIIVKPVRHNRRQNEIIALILIYF